MARRSCSARMPITACGTSIRSSSSAIRVAWPSCGASARMARSQFRTSGEAGFAGSSRRYDYVLASRQLSVLDAAYDYERRPASRKRPRGRHARLALDA